MTDLSSLELGIDLGMEQTSDLTPNIVSPEVYKNTKENLERSGYKIYTISSPRSIEEMRDEGELETSVHGADEVLIFHPDPIEVAIHPQNPYLEGSGNLTADQQKQLLEEYEKAFMQEDDEEYPEEAIKGIKAVFLPAAIVAEVDKAYRNETSWILLPAKVTEVEGGYTNSLQRVRCSDKVGGHHLTTFGRSGQKFTTNRDGSGQLTVSVVDNSVAIESVLALRAVVLPVSSEK